ncbi:Brassinosteroid-responsive RING protein 1 [Linum perenne]
MGFPVGYSEVFMPKIFVHALSFLGYLRSLIISLFSVLGISDFIEVAADNIWQQVPPPPLPPAAATAIQAVNPSPPPPSAELIREILPVIKFEELGEAVQESCAVCLYDFEGADEIRWLKNCRHVFHRACLDRWMDHDRSTCPLCRTSFVPEEMREEFDRRVWAATAGDVDDFYSEYSPIPVF